MSETPKLLPFNPLREKLLEAGFFFAGAFDFDLARAELSQHQQRYLDWIQKGHQGDMAYLDRGKERRLNPELVLPGAQAAVVVGKAYDPRPVEANGLKYARYLNGPDYHVAMNEQLSAVFEKFPNLPYKICVDTSAVLERSFGALAGLGWIGKNTMLIHPQIGSYFFIGVVLVGARFGLAPSPLKDYCGNCDRCLQACPTGAFVQARELDSRKCISYLTLEKRGPWESTLNTEGYLAGCDRCQEVCPYNTKSTKNADLHFGEWTLQASLQMDPAVLQTESEAEYRARVRGSALSRIKFHDFRRNLTAVKLS